jgi:hypothetical protein
LADNEEKEPSRQRKERENPSPELGKTGKGRELGKNASVPALREERQAREKEESEDYLKLH